MITIQSTTGFFETKETKSTPSTKAPDPEGATKYLNSTDTKDPEGATKSTQSKAPDRGTSKGSTSAKAETSTGVFDTKAPEGGPTKGYSPRCNSNRKNPLLFKTTKDPLPLLASLSFLAIQNY